MPERQADKSAEWVAITSIVPVARVLAASSLDASSFFFEGIKTAIVVNIILSSAQNRWSKSIN